MRKRFTLFMVFLWMCSLYLGTQTTLMPATGLQVASASTGVTGSVVLLGGARVMRAVPGAADFNGDGRKEIVIGTYDGRLFVIAYNGSSWTPVWSRQVALDINAANPPHPQSTSRIETAPAIADLDGDGKLEIVIPVGGLPAEHINGGILVYGYNSPWSFSIKSNWPQPKIDQVGGGANTGDPDGYWDGIYSTAAVGNLDGDGQLEIVWESEDRRIHAYHHNGTVVNGWPFYRYNHDPLARGGISSPALGDIDGDGLLEVVVGGTSPRCTLGAPPEGCGAADYSVAPVWAINGDSTLVPGWPQYVPQWVDSSPALGDIDNDGQLEIVVGTGRPGIGGTGGYRVHAWNSDGSLVPGWPKVTGSNMSASPALADLDGGGLDVIIGCGTDDSDACTYLYALHGNATNVPGFPMQPLTAFQVGRTARGLPYPPVVANIDSDNALEVLMVMNSSSGVSIVEANGANSSDVTRIQSDFLAIFSTPLVADVDNDGLLETVMAGVHGTNPGQAAVYIWDEVAPANSQRPWPMFRHDNRRTGNFNFMESPPVLPANLTEHIYLPFVRRG